MRGPVRTFILSLGVQKSGTTWLHNQVSQLPAYKCPGAKELHVFDGLHVPDCARFRVNAEKRLAALRAKGVPQKEGDFRFDHVRMFDDPEFYFDYIAALMSEDGSFSGDFTPSYSGLSADVMAMIKAGFGRRGIAVRAVLILREPVRRAESVMKMRLRRAGVIDTVTTDEVMQKMKEYALSEHDRVHASYRQTVAAARQVFDPDELYIGFYETMFRPKGVAALSQFLGLPAATFDTSVRVNETARRFRYPPEFIAKMKRTYADHYESVETDLGLPRSVWDESIAAITGPA